MTYPGGSRTAPALTVIVPSVNGAGDLLPCLEALELQRADADIEVIVVDRLGAPLRQAVVGQYPWVRILDAPAGTTIPAMRIMGFDAATGDSVAVIEDHVQVPIGWAAALLATQVDGPTVVGGGVFNSATESTVDWAAFLCEYSHCIPPLTAGLVDWLTGNNIIYPHKLLEQYRKDLSPEKWENYLHDLMRRDGVPLVCHPEIVVAHKKHYTVREYTTQRYYYARSYAGARVAGASVARRFAFGAASLALPPVLYYRVVSRVLAKHRHRAELVRSLPLLALFVTSWAAGEVIGSWFGPGDSLSRVC
ncbi:MAG: glycosyltransferase [Gemmatimonadaceae bacterium]